MTSIRWTEPTSTGFLGIIEWIAGKNPAAAVRVGRQILDTVERLAAHPHLGKPGRSPDTRELGVPRFPYLFVYSVAPGMVASEPAQVAILRVLHGAMMWPQSGDEADGRSG